MKIKQSNVNLVSNHRYYEENSVTVTSGVMTRSSFLESLKEQQKNMDVLEVTNNGEEQAIGSENYNSLKPTKNLYLSKQEATIEDQLAEIRMNLLERILNLLQLLGGDKSGRGYNDLMKRTANMLTSQSYVAVETVRTTHIQEEETSFSGKGIAYTEDGRSIEFGVDFSISKRLEEYAGMHLSKEINLIDPLVINVDSSITNISDQSFYFDLDADGKEEKISSLGKGSGFLAYDKNGDGIIGDGSELFGTRSGNGFGDLAAYDGDNNGWIDENDEIYNSLSVWIRNEDGTDTLLTLKEADVGAIYLGSANTEYTDYNSSLIASARTRASGVFLKESGGVGTVQQVDMAAL